jgi:hypothetical protein
MKPTVTTPLHLRHKELACCESPRCTPCSRKTHRPAPGTSGCLRRGSVHPMSPRLHPHSSGSLSPATGMLLAPRASLAFLECDTGTHHAFGGHRALQLAQKSSPIIPELPAFIRSVLIRQQQQPETVLSRHPSTSPYIQIPRCHSCCLLTSLGHQGDSNPLFNRHQLPWPPCCLLSCWVSSKVHGEASCMPQSGFIPQGTQGPLSGE